MAKAKKPRPLPETLEIGGHTITVELDDTLASRAECFGQWHGTRNVILVDPRFCESMVSETFLHEIIEAINEKCELKLEHPQIQVLGLLLAQALASAR